MGNAILREYTDLTKPVASGGLKDKQWKIYDSCNKKTNEKCSIFIIEKSKLPKNLQNDIFYEFIKNEVNSLIKIRHPNILRVLHPLDESRGAFVMITEPVIGSLSNFLKDENCDVISPNDRFEDFSLQTIELKNGLRQICDTLQFLHRTCHTIYHNLHPHNIYITDNGDWKLAGFGFLVPDSQNPQIDFHNGSTMSGYFPSLDFTAPEIIHKELSSPEADVFSLAILSLYLHRNQNTQKLPPIIKDLSSYERYIATLSTTINEILGQSSLSSLLSSMVSLKPQDRPSLETFLNCDYFNDKLVRALWYLDTILEKDTSQRIAFLKQLPSLLPQYDHRILMHRVLPSLLLQLQDENIAIFVLPSLLLISKDMKKEKFQNNVLPGLLKLFSKNSHPNIIFVLLKDLDILLTQSPDNIHRDYIIPMINRILDGETVPLKKLCLKMIVEVSKKNRFNYRDLKSSILPRICNICSLSPTNNPNMASNVVLGFKVSAMMCINEIFHLFDSDTVTTTILSNIDKALSTSRVPAMLMCALGIYTSISDKYSLDISVKHILPKLIPLSMETSLNYQQFNKYMNTIHKIINKFEEMRSKELKEKHNILEESSDIIKNKNTNNDLLSTKPQTKTDMDSILNQEFGGSVKNQTKTFTINNDFFDFGDDINNEIKINEKDFNFDDILSFSPAQTTPLAPSSTSTITSSSNSSSDPFSLVNTNSVDPSYSLTQTNTTSVTTSSHIPSSSSKYISDPLSSLSINQPSVSQNSKISEPNIFDMFNNTSSSNNNIDSMIPPLPSYKPKKSQINLSSLSSIPSQPSNDPFNLYPSSNPPYQSNMSYSQQIPSRQSQTPLFDGLNVMQTPQSTQPFSSQTSTIQPNNNNNDPFENLTTTSKPHISTSNQPDPFANLTWNF